MSGRGKCGRKGTEPSRRSVHNSGAAEMLEMARALSDTVRILERTVKYVGARMDAAAHQEGSRVGVLTKQEMAGVEIPQAPERSTLETLVQLDKVGVEAPGQQVVAPTQGDGAGSISGLIKEAKELGAIPFSGVVDPLEADRWILDLEKIFEVMGCTEVQKQRLATSFLSSDAYHWWSSIAHAKEMANMTWLTFKAMFYEKYFPPIFRMEKADEFIALEQGSMTVGQYEAKFSELSRFALNMISDEVIMVRMFERGLTPRVRRLIVPLCLRTYPLVVERALLVESFYDETYQQQKGNGRVTTQQFQKKYRGQFQQGERGQQGQRDNQGQHLQKRQRVAYVDQHTTVVPIGATQSYGLRSFSGQCYNCCERGHISRNCPKPRRYGQYGC